MWEQIESLKLEIGYPGLGGKIIWKGIGWIQDKANPIGRSFAHALWNPNMTNIVMLFDFLPALIGNTNETEKNYRIRAFITTKDGRNRTAKSGPIRDRYADEFFTLMPQYPGAKGL